jgi:hypothetical protein
MAEGSARSWNHLVNESGGLRLDATGVGMLPTLPFGIGYIWRTYPTYIPKHACPCTLCFTLKSYQ